MTPDDRRQLLDQVARDHAPAVAEWLADQIDQADESAASCVLHASRPPRAAIAHDAIVCAILTSAATDVDALDPSGDTVAAVVCRWAAERYASAATTMAADATRRRGDPC